MVTVTELRRAIARGRQQLASARATFTSAQALATALAEEFDRLNADGAASRTTDTGERLTGHIDGLTAMINGVGKTADAAGAIATSVKDER